MSSHPLLYGNNGSWSTLAHIDTPLENNEGKSIPEKLAMKNAIILRERVIFQAASFKGYVTRQNLGPLLKVKLLVGYM